LQKNKKKKILALIFTIVTVLVIVVLLLILGLIKQVPPPPEYGVELNLGDALVGMGKEQPDELNSENATSATSSTSEDAENLASNNEEISIKKTAIKPTNQPQQQKPTTAPTPSTSPVSSSAPTVNPNALFPGKKPSAGGSEGTGDVAGDQGDPRGTPSGTSYTGESGTGSGGISFSLTGRQATSLPKPNYNSDEQGIVVVKIWVDETGKVYRAEPGEKNTNTTNTALLNAAKEAALKSRFSVKENAPSAQGTITYKFIKLN
jgi:outer membrane biosynthesis protein TonB